MKESVSGSREDPSAIHHRRHIVIPKILHQLWVGPPMPDLYADWVDGWRRLHPEWEHRLWAEAPDLRNKDLYENAERISSSPWQFRSDVARYEILHNFGGVWVDVDFQPQKPIDDLMHTAWVVQHAGKWVANGIMAMPPQHPAMAEAIRLLPGSVAAHPDAANTVRSGPQFLTPIIHRHSDIHTLPGHLFLPYEWNELYREGEDFPDAYAVHHWHNQRKRKGLMV